MTRARDRAAGGKDETKIAPKKYRGVSFGKIEHYHYYPKIGGRYVLVFTFK